MSSSKTIEMNIIMKNLLIIIAIVLITLGAFSFFKSDEYIGFYYPDTNNLSSDIQSLNSFESLEECKSWINEQVSKYNPSGSGYDYECGKNCDLSKDKPYICEETLK